MAKAPKKRNLVTIDNGLIMTMLADARFLTAFPCLQAIAKKRKTATRAKGCARCGRSMRNKTDDFDKARACLGGQGGTGRNKLKALLNTKKIRIRFKKGNGTVTEFTY